MNKGQIIYFEGIGMVSIALADRSSIKFKDITLVPDCKSNLISLGQLQKNRIIYHNTNSSMLFI